MTLKIVVPSIIHIFSLTKLSRTQRYDYENKIIYKIYADTVHSF